MEKLKRYFIKIKNFKITRRVIIEILLALSLTIISSLLYFNQVAISFYLHGFQSLKSGVQLYSIYVGQGDSSFIILPNKISILVDTGLEDYAEKFCNELGFLMKSNGIQQIDYLFLTHPDSDHIGGALEVFENFEVENIYRPIINIPSEAKENGYKVSEDGLYVKVIEEAEKEGKVSYILPQEIEVGESVIKIYSPLSSYYSEDNNYSPVMTVSGENFSFMFTGDLEAVGENEFLEQYKDERFDVDVLKVAHHGSKNSTSEEFLELIKPEIALISAGVDNVYNFPNDQLSSRLQESGVKKIYSTSELGTIGISQKGETFIMASGFIFQEKSLFIVIYFALLFSIFSVRESRDLKKKKFYSKQYV